jgi:hypothetical protein
MKAAFIRRQNAGVPETYLAFEPGWIGHPAGMSGCWPASNKDARFYDLLDSSVYLLLSQNPGRIAEETSPGDRIVVIWVRVQRYRGSSAPPFGAGRTRMGGRWGINRSSLGCRPASSYFAFAIGFFSIVSRTSSNVLLRACWVLSSAR